MRRRRGERSLAARSTFALAMCGILMALAGTAVSATFSTNSSTAPHTSATSTLVAPAGVTCAWTGSNALSVNWTNTNGTTATGHTVERSNTSGAGFATLGTTSPASVVTLADANPAPPTLRYYRLKATVANWTSAITSEVVSNTCTDSVVAFAGGGASTACSYSGPASGLSLNFLQNAAVGVTSSSAGLAADASGNIYVADTQNHCVRKIDAAGNVSRVAGGGATATCGTTTASNVQLLNPQGVTVDSSGNVYIADSGNNCIRKVAGTTVTKVAGGGATSTCTSTTSANVSLSTPTGIAVDSGGNVYVGDSGNKCVRKIDGSGNVTAFLGTGGSGTGCSASGTAPTSVTLRMIDQVVVDTSNNIYVADGAYSCIYKVASGTVTKIIGGGGTQTSCASTANPNTAGYSATYPAGIAVSATGAVFYTLSQDSDPFNRACVKKLTGTTEELTAGSNGTGSSGNNGPAVAAKFNKPTSLCLSSSGDLYVSDIADQVIRKIIAP